ncbi:3-phosphoserine/phosphohydroxythreonine transaminase [Desulfobotulus sp. H1]|uniref:Phosphoserine aminotransferase n=1 Tax=Desulfobotulus pelophilus TaxID=2823377 RepID=A0ABT3N8T3_9BACT|nr:3-phosphoserine/phosphohydroxythreonine transaminase [Desulfobotulus pelophilus]MCW7753862.1 3-phosphoserine/phosphohydroxythreonine transaminase [Desulfobotulus pelophilus]
MTERIHNFNPGPAALPLSVLEKVQAEMLNFRDSGMSILEISHRSDLFGEVLASARNRARRLFNLPDNYRVLFIQGGASLQFAMAPMNFLGTGDRADYINTGTWATKAFEQATLLGKNVRYAASSEDQSFSCIPTKADIDTGARYVHITSNNTIRGTQWRTYPDTGGIPLVCDMCSDMLSRPVPVEKFGLIYAGAQKNLGPAGLTLVIIREDMLLWNPDAVMPTLMRYKTYSDHYSMYNTPPCFGIYVAEKVMAWLEEDIGGLEAMASLNAAKAERLYGALDATDFYQGTAAEADRSLMNVTFRLRHRDLEAIFIKEALAAGLGGLKGHKSVGGCRASLYNATGMDAVESLVAFMKNFEKRMG